MNTSPTRVALAALFSLLAFSTSALSQDLDRAELSGTVVDSNNAAVRDSSVSITSDSGSRRTVFSDSMGRYRFVALAPGIYSLSVSMEGFEDFHAGAIPLGSSMTARIDVTLRAAQVTAAVTVNATEAASMIDLKKVVVGGSLVQATIAELPNLKSDILDFALLFGGSTDEALSVRELAEDEDSSSRVTPVEQGLVSLSGGTAYSNNLTIDGLDNNDDRTSRERFVPPAGSVAELQVIRNQFSAEYGRASGGRINIRSKSGAKALKGTLTLNLRDDRLNANTWNNNSRGIARPPFHETRSSAFVSGPACLFGCIRDTTFASSYEFGRTGDTTLIDTFLPTNGNASFELPRPNGSQLFCETAVEEECFGPLPIGAPIASFTSLLRTPNTSHSALIRLDSRALRQVELNASLQLGIKAFRRSNGGPVGRLEESLQSKRVFTDALNLSILTFGRRYTNQIRFQRSTLSPSFEAPDPLRPVAIINFKNPLTGAGSTLVAGGSNASTLQNFAESRLERRLQAQDTLTVFSGSRTFRGGFDLQHVDSKATALTDASGTFNFPTMRSFVQGNVSRFRQNFGTASDVRNFYGGFFMNEELSLADNLNLSLGARYEMESVLADSNNVAPRVGIAWNPRADGITLIRAGAGMFYNRVLLRTVGDFKRAGGPLTSFDTNLIGTSSADPRRTSVLAAISQIFPRTFSDSTQLQSLIGSLWCGSALCSSDLGFTRPDSLSLPLRTIDSRIRIPESFQFNIGIERQLAPGLTVEADLSLNETNKLWREFDSNAAKLPEGYPDWTAFLLANPFTFVNSNGRIRTYRFYLGLPTDPNVSVQPGASGSCSTTLTVTCWVNINSLSGTVTAPSTATADSSNSIGSPIGIALAAIARFRPDQNVERRETIASVGGASYKGLVIGLRLKERRAIKGIKVDGSVHYTLSHQLDDGLNNTSNAEVNGDFKRERARGLQDRRHRLTAFGTAFLPNKAGGLRLSSVVRLGSSAPFNISTGMDRNLDGSSTDRPVFDGISRIVWRRPGSPFPSGTYSRLSLPPIGSRSGSLPRNAGTGPRLFLFDLNLSRTIRITDKVVARPNLEIGNILNATVFSYGAEYVDFNALGPTPTPSQIASRERFLVPTRTMRQREMRAGMRIEF